MQMKPDHEFNKQFDLEETEYRVGDAPEPFWGPEAKYVGIMFLLGFPVSALAALLVTGEFPYWLRNLIQ